MKRIIEILAIFSIGASSAFADPCGQSEFSDKMATKAKNQVSQKYLAMPGVTGVGVANCDDRWLPWILGKSVSVEARSPNCGVKVLFVGRPSERRFGRWASQNLPEGKIPVALENGITVLVPVCGYVTGEVGPQPGGTVSN